MKLTKLFFIVLTFFSSSKGFSNELENYFERTLENEKQVFLDCIKSEKLPEQEATKTNCYLSDIAKEAFYILEKKKLTKYDFLDNFSPPKVKKKIVPKYPRSAQALGIQGYVILKYDLDINGKPSNISREEGKCEDLRVTEFFQNCSYFYISAGMALKKFVYEPAQFKNRNVKSFNNLHKFTFLLEDSWEDLKYSLKKTDSLIEKKEFDKALEISLSKEENIFKYQIGRIYLEQENYQDASYWFKEFLENIESEPPKRVAINSVIFLIQSLFYSGKYNEIVLMDKSIDNYFRNNSDYDEEFALTNFYIGAAFINQGNLSKGAYYFYRAKESTTDENTIKTIQQYIDQIAAYFEK